MENTEKQGEDVNAILEALKKGGLAAVAKLATELTSPSRPLLILDAHALRMHMTVMLFLNLFLCLFLRLFLCLFLCLFL